MIQVSHYIYIFFLLNRLYLIENGYSCFNTIIHSTLGQCWMTVQPREQRAASSVERPRANISIIYWQVSLV